MLQSIGYANLAKLDPQYGLCRYLTLVVYINILLLLMIQLYYKMQWVFIVWIFSNMNYLFDWFPDTSVVPPLIYAVMGSSRDIAIGPVAVVSMLLSTLVTKVIDPVANPHAYRDFIFTVTFFTGIFQVAFGVFRYLINFLI